MPSFIKAGVVLVVGALVATVAYVAWVRHQTRAGDRASLEATKAPPTLDLCRDALWDASATRPIRIAGRLVRFPCAGQGDAGPVLADGAVAGFSLQLRYRAEEGIALVGARRATVTGEVDTGLQGSIVDVARSLPAPSVQRIVLASDRVQIVETSTGARAIAISRRGVVDAPPILISCPAQTLESMQQLLAGTFEAASHPPVLCDLDVQLHPFAVTFRLTPGHVFLANAPRSADQLLEFLSQFGINDHST